MGVPAGPDALAAYYALAMGAAAPPFKGGDSRGIPGRSCTSREHAEVPGAVLPGRAPVRAGMRRQDLSAPLRYTVPG